MKEDLKKEKIFFYFNYQITAPTRVRQKNEQQGE